MKECLKNDHGKSAAPLLYFPDCGNDQGIFESKLIWVIYMRMLPSAQRTETMIRPLQS